MYSQSWEPLGYKTGEALTHIPVTLHLYTLLMIQLSGSLAGIWLKAATLEGERKATNEKTLKAAQHNNESLISSVKIENL